MSYITYSTGLNLNNLIVSTENIVNVTGAVNINVRVGIAPYKYILKDDIVYILVVNVINWSIDRTQGFLLNENGSIDYLVEV